MRVEAAEIKYTEPRKIDGAYKKVDVVDSVHLRQIKYRKRAALFANFRGNLQPNDEGKIDLRMVPPDRDANFTVQMIVDAVCNSAGEPAVTADEVDEWSEPKIRAYFNAALRFQSPTVEDTAKNSSSTESVAN